MTLTTLNLHQRSVRAMEDAGLKPQFPSPVLEASTEPEQGPKLKVMRDLRGLLWTSIDNLNTTDLDQVQFVERLSQGRLRLMVAIADVDAYVQINSEIDKFAAERSASIYTGYETFPMIPDSLSQNRTSLHEHEIRRAIVVEMRIDEQGNVSHSEVFGAIVRNGAKLDYDSIGAWLQTKAMLPSTVSRIPGIEAQLRLQEEAAKLLKRNAHNRGALELDLSEAAPIMENGELVGLASRHKSPARDIIEAFMVAANVSIMSFLRERGIPYIERVVKTPRRWDRIVEIAENVGGHLPPVPSSFSLAAFLAERRRADSSHFRDISLAIVKLLGAGEYSVTYPGGSPERHFGLATVGYTHATAPNRRYVDLVIQRLIKYGLDDNLPLPYTTQQLEKIAVHCNAQAIRARKVERQMRKIMASAFLVGRIGQKFDAIITGIKESGTYLRVISPPIEGKVVRNTANIHVGDQVTAELVFVDTEHGYIDFAVV